jgi:hypothetical protein
MRLSPLVAIPLLVLAQHAIAQSPRGYEDEPSEYRDRKDQQEAYRRGYERGYDRGFERGLQEGQKRGLATQNVAPPPPPAPPPPVLGPIKVTSAFYGSGKKNCDATRFAARKVNGQRTASFKVSNDMCGDPDHGQRKTLEITYWCGQVARTASAREHQDIYLNCMS